ncbi:HIT domain protein, partial [Chlamydia psittaci 84-8471/1]
KLFSN